MNEYSVMEIISLKLFSPIKENVFSPCIQFISPNIPLTCQTSNCYKVILYWKQIYNVKADLYQNQLFEGGSSKYEKGIFSFFVLKIAYKNIELQIIYMTIIIINCVCFLQCNV